MLGFQLFPERLCLFVIAGLNSLMHLIAQILFFFYGRLSMTSVRFPVLFDIPHIRGNFLFPVLCAFCFILPGNRRIRTR